MVGLAKCFKRFILKERRGGARYETQSPGWEGQVDEGIFKGRAEWEIFGKGLGVDGKAG
jgi:hypothetical protein